MADNAILPLLKKPMHFCRGRMLQLVCRDGYQNFWHAARGEPIPLNSVSSLSTANIVYQKGGWVLTAGYYSLFPHNLIRSHNKNDPWGCFHTHARTERAFHQIIIRASTAQRINIIQHPKSAEHISVAGKREHQRDWGYSISSQNRRCSQQQFSAPLMHKNIFRIYILWMRRAVCCRVPSRRLSCILSHIIRRFSSSLAATHETWHVPQNHFLRWCGVTPWNLQTV